MIALAAILTMLTVAAPAEGAAEPAPVPPEEAGAAVPCVQDPDRPVRINIGTVEAGTEVGKAVPIPIRVYNVCDLASFEIGLNFDPSIAKLERTELMPFLAGKPAVDVAFTGWSVQQHQGIISARRPPGSGGVDGTGSLIRMIFVGKRAGSTPVQLIRLTLLRSDGAEIATEVIPLRLTVLPEGGLEWHPHRAPKPRR